MGCDHQGEESVGNCPLTPGAEPALGAGSPVCRPFGPRGDYEGTCRRMCCCDHWLPPVRTQEAAAELSSADCCWKAHLQAPAKSSSLHKTVLNFNCSAYGFDTGNGSMTYCLLVQNLEKSRVGIDICVCSLLHAMVALLHQEGCLAKRCKYGRIFCMYTRAKGPALVNILPCPPIEKGGEWIHRASAHFHIVSRGQ